MLGDQQPEVPEVHDLERHEVEPVNKAGVREPLYAARKKVFPKRARGTFRRLKWWIMLITLGIYYITPWLRWERGGAAPDQAVLIDIADRRFYFFFIEIWPQELYYITGLLVMAALGLFCVTSVIGRAWCGYTCPQTVWVDLFIAVERIVLGDRAARIRFDKSPMGAAKVAKLSTLYAIWLAISVATGGAWVFYFADAPTLLEELVTGYAPAEAYITIGILTFTTFTLGGFMREQVCTYMCPWPRIQATMMDEESLTVAYKPDRGEPRAAYRKGDSFDGRGDCIDCNACVVVCPQGIDIRDGQQLECITCALCIDACDDVMSKISRPRGLVDYDSVANLNRRVEHRKTSIKFFRPRTLAYLGAWSAIGCLMLFALFTRSDLDVNVLHNRNPLFTQLKDGSIRNVYTLKVLNKAHQDRTVTVVPEGLPGASLEIVGRGRPEETGSLPTVAVKPDRVEAMRILVTVPQGAVKAEKQDLEFVVADIATGQIVRKESFFRGPKP